MSFQSYPVISFGSNIDLIRQGHNFLTTNVGDINGLQTSARDSLVDAINSLSSAFSALTVSAYPPLNNEQWLTATTFSGFGTLNLFKLSSNNEFVVGQHIIPLSTLTDLGKSGTAWRNGYITTVVTAKVQAVTNLELASASTLTLSLANSNLILTELSGTALKLESVGESLDIKSTLTSLFSGSHFWRVSATGAWQPGVTNTQDLGASTNRIKDIYTNTINASGDVTFNGDVIMPNAGAALPIGGGCIWFLPTIPNNYLIANGQAVSRTAYPALFALFGTYYGIGDGVTSFNLPDMRGRMPFGVNPEQTANPDAGAPGRTFGAINHTHNVLLPKHYHTSAGLSIANHENQVTGAPSVLPSAGFIGNTLSAHGHGITQSAHSHGISDPGHNHHINDPGHAHGAGLGDHSHPLNCGTKGSGNTQGNAANWTPVGGGGQIGLFNGLSDYDIFTFGAGVLGVSISPAATGVYNSPSGTGIGIVGANANISINTASAGTPSGSVTLSNTSHSHTIPTLTHTISGTVGTVAGGANGDIDNTLISSASNPPSMAVHFIIRAK